MDYLRWRDLFGDTGIRSFGWVEGGYTGASSGQGILSVQPRLNRFGNEFLFNEIGWVVEKPLQQDQCNLGFNDAGISQEPTRPWAQPRVVSVARPATRTSVRTFATCTCRPICRSSPTAVWTSRSAA